MLGIPSEERGRSAVPLLRSRREQSLTRRPKGRGPLDSHQVGVVAVGQSLTELMCRSVPADSYHRRLGEALRPESIDLL